MGAEMRPGFIHFSGPMRAGGGKKTTVTESKWEKSREGGEVPLGIKATPAQ